VYERIAVGTDLSTTSRVAVEQAASLAEKLGAELILIYAGRDPGDALQQLADEHGAKAVVAQGSPADVLLEQANELHAGLLVVGSVGMSGAKRFALGNVPNKVSHHADRDLLIVKTDKPKARKGAYSNILVGTDGSPTAMRAVEMASKLGRLIGVKPLVMTAYEPPSEHELEQLRSGTGDAIGAWNATREQRQTPSDYQWRLADAAQAEDILERAVDYADKVDAEIEVRAVEGPAPDLLLDIADQEDMDLIVVGSVGMHGTKRFMLGNVPHRISHHSPVDVLILHTA
jgi:nucleotide-binding universal stress UspA family protein